MIMTSGFCDLVNFLMELLGIKSVFVIYAVCCSHVYTNIIILDISRHTFSF